MGMVYLPNRHQILCDKYLKEFVHNLHWLKTSPDFEESHKYLAQVFNTDKDKCYKYALKFSLLHGPQDKVQDHLFHNFNTALVVWKDQPKDKALAEALNGLRILIQLVTGYKLAELYDLLSDGHGHLREEYDEEIDAHPGQEV